MPEVIPLNAYHLRCLRALVHRASRNETYTRPRSSVTFWRTFSSGVSALRPDPAQSNRRSKTQDKKPQTKGWRTLLGKETLGERRSVLVLRDTERKRSQPEKDGKEEVDLGALKVFSDIETILARTRAHRSIPTDEEVREFIDSLAPQQREAGPDALAVSKEDYQRLLEGLSQAFDKHQLSVYLAGNPASGEKDTTPPKAELEFTNIRCSKWHVKKTDGPKQGLHGRTAQVDTILRGRWKLRILEEENLEGSLKIWLTKLNLAILLTGQKNNSQLRKVGQRYNTSVQIKMSGPIIRVSGAREACLSVAKEIDTLLGGLEIERFDFRPFISSIGSAAKATMIKKALSLAARFNCHASCLEEEAFEIHGLFPGVIERYKKALWAKLPRPGVETPLRRSLYNGDSTLQPCTLSGIERTQDLLPFHLQDEHWGRFVVPRPRQDELAETNGSSSQSKSNTAPAADFHEIRRQTRLVNTIQKDTSTGNQSDTVKSEATSESLHWKQLPGAFSIHFGQILLSIPLEQLVTPKVIKNIKSLITKERVFMPSNLGLTQFLLTSHREAHTTLAKLICVGLSPSPWNKSNTAENATLPAIEVWFSVSEDHTSAKLKAVVANLQSVCVDVVMPHQNLDFVFERQDLAILKNAKSNANIKSFAEQIEDSVSRGVKLNYPSSLKLNIPYTVESKAPGRPKIQHVAGEGFRGVEHEYCTTSIDYHEVLTLSYQGQQLTFRSINKGKELESRESITLQTAATIRDTATVDEEQTFSLKSDKKDQVTTRLMQSAHDLLAELKQGVQTISLKEPSEWRRRRVQKKSGEFSLGIS